MEAPHPSDGPGPLKMYAQHQTMEASLIQLHVMATSFAPCLVVGTPLEVAHDFLTSGSKKPYEPEKQKNRKALLAILHVALRKSLSFSRVLEAQHLFRIAKNYSHEEIIFSEDSVVGGGGGIWVLFCPNLPVGKKFMRFCLV